MAVAVQKYIKNMAKSITYTASDVLSTKFEYVKDFKNENQEVFKVKNFCRLHMITPYLYPNRLTAFLACFFVKPSYTS